MKKIQNMAILAFAAMAVLFTSCGSDDDNNSGLENEYFTIQNATVHKGSIPNASSGNSIGDVTVNRNVLPGGSSFVSINSVTQIQEIYVSVEGVNEYYRVVASTETQFVILFSQNLNRSFTIQMSALLIDGSQTQLYTAQLQFIKVGTGALQVSLSFDNDKDVDLFVVEPNGNVIYYSNPGGKIWDEEARKYVSIWGLDLDSNALCNIDGVNNENIYYPTEYIQSGTYEVWVNMFINCDPSIPTNWVIAATKHGSLVSVTDGQNPAGGVFPAGTPGNPSGYPRNGALKVMEFTMEGSYNPSASVRPAYQPEESAVMKMQMAGELMTK
ncbi:MAG: hypothetical protein LBK94_06945 [Prevotellaceae bacterium]|nr:hypothetical protein [Prevotellaceae bacterium]